MPHARSTAQLIDPSDGTQLAIKPGTLVSLVVDALDKAGKTKAVQDGLALLGLVRVRRKQTWLNFQARVNKWVDASGAAGFKVQNKDATCIQFRNSDSDALVVSLQWDATACAAPAASEPTTQPAAEPATEPATQPAAEPAAAAADGWCSVM